MPLPPTILEPRGQEGPAMRKLNERRKAFVRNYVERGNRNAAQAYKDAGYTCKNDQVARVNGCIVLHHVDVQEAIREYSLAQLVSLAPIATKVMCDVLDNPQVDAAVRVKAAIGVWDRAGMAAKTEHKVTVERTGSDPQKIAEARKLVETLGLSNEQVAALFGKNKAPVILDASYKEIEKSGSEGVRRMSHISDIESVETVDAENEAFGEEVPEEEEIRF